MEQGPENKSRRNFLKAGAGVVAAGVGLATFSQKDKTKEPNQEQFERIEEGEVFDTHSQDEGITIAGRSTRYVREIFITAPDKQTFFIQFTKEEEGKFNTFTKGQKVRFKYDTRDTSSFKKAELVEK